MFCSSHSVKIHAVCTGASAEIQRRQWYRYCVARLEEATPATRDTPLHSPISQQRDRKSHDSPPTKAVPGHHRNSFASFWCYALSFPLSRRCSESPDLVVSSDFSAEQPSLQITPSNSSTVQFLHSLADFRCLAARLGVNFGRRFTSYFIISLSGGTDQSSLATHRVHTRHLVALG